MLGDSHNYTSAVIWGGKAILILWPPPWFSLCLVGESKQNLTKS